MTILKTCMYTSCHISELNRLKKKNLVTHLNVSEQNEKSLHKTLIAFCFTPDIPVTVYTKKFSSVSYSTRKIWNYCRTVVFLSSVFSLIKVPLVKYADCSNSTQNVFQY